MQRTGFVNSSQTDRWDRFLTLVLACWAIWQAFESRWISDDAFISFRYAQHLSRGDGLVYNVGEYVEGYTNLLWTLLMLPAFWMEIPIHHWTNCFSLGFFVHMLWLLHKIPANRSSSIIALVAGIEYYRLFATSGLETQLFLWSIVVTIMGILKGSTKVIMTGMIIGVLTRPEGALLWFCASTILFGKKGFQEIFGVGLVTLLGLEGFRWFYYGDFLPNTFYAKAVNANFVQGMLYISVFFKSYPWVLLAIPSGVVLWKDADIESNIKDVLWFVLLFSGIFALHVCRAGGDFMMARFALPWVLPLLMILGLTLDRYIRNSVGAILLFVLGLCAFIPKELNSIENGQFGIQGITNEHVWYPEEWRVQAETQGKAIQPFFQNSDATVVIYGAQAMFAYYAEFPYVLEGMTGLTDRALASLPNQDSRIGHGRKASVTYLQQRGIDFYVDFRLNQSQPNLNHISFGEMSGSILSYKVPIMKQMREKGAVFTDFPAFLDQYLNHIHSKSTAEINRDYHLFTNYYFRHNHDIDRQQRFEEHLQE